MRKKLFLILLPFIAMLTVFYLIKTYTLSVDCQLNDFKIPNKNISLQVAAVFNYDCASHFPDVPQKNRINFALRLGYPSLLFKLTDTERVLAVINAIADEGDRGFFRFDPKILEILKKQKKSQDLEKTIDFVRATLEPEKAFSESDVSHEFLLFLPLWQEPRNMKLMQTWCRMNTCEKTETKCGIQVGLEDKLKLTQGKTTLEKIYAKCPIDIEWMRALRRAGLMDTACTASYQINNILDTLATDNVNEQTSKLKKPCFTKDTSLLDSPTQSFATTVRYLRFIFYSISADKTSERQAIIKQAEILNEIQRYFDSLLIDEKR